MLTQLFLKLTYVGAEWVMWVLLFLSIISIALMVERSLYFMRNRVDGDALAAQLYEQLRVRNLQGAWDLVKGSEVDRVQRRGGRPVVAARRDGSLHRSDAEREGPYAAAAGRESVDPGHDRHQHAVHRACWARCWASSKRPTN